MQLNITLKEAYGRASNRLRRKMEYSIHLLRKAEKLALAYDTRGGIAKNAYHKQPCGTVLGKTGSRYAGKTIDDYGYIQHPDPNHWKAGFQIAHRLTA